jgi:hypothetical protein
MAASLFNTLRNSQVRYDEDNVRRSLVVIRHAKSSRLINAHKENIMMALSQIIVKNVNNFFNLVRHTEECRLLHEKDDIVGECYMMLEKCLQKFDINRNKNFFWYYNKSLSMGLFRLAKRVYKKDVYFKDFSDLYGGENKLMHNKIQQALDPMIMRIDFSPEQIEYLESKINDEKIGDFLSRTGVQRTVYTRLGKEVKVKLQSYYDDFRS